METLKLLLTIYGICYLLSIPGLWKIFEKSGQKGWHSLVPIYNFVVLLNIIGWSGWYVLAYLVPLFAIIMDLIISLKLSKTVGTNSLFAIGMWRWPTRPIFFAILGFGEYDYIGSDGVI